MHTHAAKIRVVPTSQRAGGERFFAIKRALSRFIDFTIAINLLSTSLGAGCWEGEYVFSLVEIIISDIFATSRRTR